MNKIMSLLVKILKKYLPGTFEYLHRHRADILASYLEKDRVPNLVVSFTTFHPRLDVFEYAVLSILAGSVLPEKILIYTPQGFKDLVLNNPKSFIKNELNKGLINIIEMEEDLICHSKYFYSFSTFGNACDIVICDDDVVYYKDWLKDLIQARDTAPDFDVFAFKAVEVTTQDGIISSYNDWQHFSRSYHPEGKFLYPEGVGGVLFRKNRLVKEVLNKDVFLQITPKADDVWLWFCIGLNNLKTKYVIPSNNKRLLYVIPNSQTTNLWTENTINKRNDQYVLNCQSYFLKKYNFDIVDKISRA